MIYHQSSVKIYKTLFLFVTSVQNDSLTNTSLAHRLAIDVLERTQVPRFYSKTELTFTHYFTKTIPALFCAMLFLTK